FSSRRRHTTSKRDWSSDVCSSDLIINIIYVKKKSDETPEFDERTMKNMRTFYFYAAMTFLILVFVASGILLVLDISSISVLLLFLVSFGFFVISGIVALIISIK